MLKGFRVKGSGFRVYGSAALVEQYLVEFAILNIE